MQNILKRSNAIFPLFLGCLIKHGQKTKALQIFYYLLIHLRYIFKKNPFLFLEKIIERTRPIVHYSMYYIKRRIIYKSRLITIHRSRMLAIKWILIAAKIRFENTFKARILSELLNLYKNKRGFSYKKQKEIYKMVLKNRQR